MEDFNIKNITEIINKIKISDYLYEKIKNRYTNLGNWLDRSGSSIKIYTPLIYPQGSVALGTIIQPINTDCYDVDLVCEFKNINKQNISPFNFKHLIKEELEKYIEIKNLNAKLKESKKCWTIEYTDSVPFHIDILPAISELNNNILITDKSIEGYNILPGNWCFSNPRNFAKWVRDFDISMIRKSSYGKKVLGPEYMIPIQNKINNDSIFKVILMLIKRHRDVFFIDNEEYKTPSIIITTLACNYYRNLWTVNPIKILDAYSIAQIIIKEIHLFSKNTSYDVINPAHNKENFADKLNNNKDLIKHFKLWSNELNNDFESNKFIKKIEESIIANTKGEI